MAVVAFSKPVAFPTAPLRDLLDKHLPLFRWQCGEDDTGAPRQMGRFTDHMLISGRSPGSVVFTELRATLGPSSEPAPPHEWHLRVGTPTTDKPAISDRITLILCMTVMVMDEDLARCQLLPGGNWLTAQELLRVFKLVLNGENLSVAAGLGQPARAAAEPSPRGAGRYADLSPDRAAALADMDESMARMLHERGMGDIANGMGLTLPPGFAHEMPRDNALPTLVMLSTQPLFLDWLRIAEGLKAADPAGDWTVSPTGPTTGSFSGRGATVTVACHNQPLPAYLTAQGLSREHFLKPEHRAQITSHNCHQTISVDLDTRAADFIAVRQTAKAVAMFMALPANNPAFVGLYNAGTGVAKPVERVRDSIAALHQDEVPVAIWTWVAPDSILTDAVAISSAGMRPFVGYEVECWNAPGTLDTVADRLNGVMRYLLINGPIINHGDTIGDDAGTQSTRCFFGSSKAQRGAADVPAMLVEFDGQSGASPKADAPVADDAQAALAALRRGASATSLQALDAIASAIEHPSAGNGANDEDNPVLQNLMTLIRHEQETGALPAPRSPVPSPAPLARRTGGFGRKGL